MQRTGLQQLMVVVAVGVMGCSDKLGPLHPVAGPDVVGMWSGSNGGVTLSVTLDTIMCEVGCVGAVTGGEYIDSKVGANAPLNSGEYSAFPPGEAPYSSPLPGWYIIVNPADSADVSINLQFRGTFSSATALPGTVVYQKGAATDTVNITLTKQ